MGNNIKGILEKHARDIISGLRSASERSIYNIPMPLLAALLLHLDECFLIIEDTPEHAEALRYDIDCMKTLSGVSRPEVLCLPPPSSVENCGERARIAGMLASGKVQPLITSPDALTPGFFVDEADKRMLSLESGQELQRAALEERLVAFGYRKVGVVMEKGEYAERGWLFDIFPSTEEQPVRVEFFGDELDEMKTFDIETQRSTGRTGRLSLYPATEADGGRSQDILSLWTGDLYINSASGIQASSMEPVRQRAVFFSHFVSAGEGIDAGAAPVAGLGILPAEAKGGAGLASALDAQPKNTIIIFQSHGQVERFREIVSPAGLIAPIMAAKAAGLYEGARCVTQGRLSGGLHLRDLLILTGREIFGEQPAYRPMRKSRVSRLLLTIDDLKPGDFVVHVDHGIGRFVGLHKERSEAYEGDVITLEYAAGDRLYIPFHGIEKLSKYSGGEGNAPPLDRLGGRRWQNTKRKVGKSVKDMAEKLLRIHAERKAPKAYICGEDGPMHAEFDGFFPYEETEDQVRATRAIIKHMQSEQPMDMLLCGDVGYGKTEVAIKAAFRAVYDGRQVAVLVPTTLLAEQHYRTFCARFAAFPVRIDYLSRFKGGREVRDTIAALAGGEIDIVIGTHMLLGKHVAFQDLGLIIIDEEHRFGVAQKERLKEMRRGVDVITLTATPIPRTLHMALSGIREIETIETPPEERLAVRSVVCASSDRIISEAIDRELKREGQVFFLHNRITDMERVVSMLRRLAPKARIAHAHGRMQERQLEEIMLAFLRRETDILVSTAIISSGLDIPTANTIIIDRSDTFGLSDLYQLRGRVGRGNVQAYAYFLIPGEDVITGDAGKRLQAIQEMSYLGAGFRLALKDLDIRGAGNLLGGEQSGHICKVGFEMYMEMLERAVAELKGEAVPEETKTQITVPLPSYIPDEYVSDIALRLSLYKRLSGLKAHEDLDAFESELTDRFGSPPAEVRNLLGIVRIKQLAQGLFVSRISCAAGYCRFVMGAEAGPALPEGLAGRMLEALFALQKRGRRDRTLRFLQDGFELVMPGVVTEKTLLQIENLLEDLHVALQERSAAADLPGAEEKHA
jgi:transcription-repair coupling factor (superfamily II helicase)